MITVVPQSAIFDEPIEIVVKSLVPHQSIVLHLLLDHRSGKFHSWATFLANEYGCVNLNLDPSIDGTYVGVDGMGLFSTLEQMSNQRFGLRFMPKATDRIEYQLEVIDGTLIDNGRCISSTIIERYLLHPNVQVVDVEHGRIRGKLYYMKNHINSKDIPAIIDLYGTGGGLFEYRAALLASKGFAVLALAYFLYKDLPSVLGDVDLNYFEEAIDWLTSLPFTSDTVGFIGLSFGANIAISLASIPEDKISAVVSINGSCIITNTAPIKLNGSLLPYMVIEDLTQEWKIIDNVIYLADRYQQLIETNAENKFVPIENCNHRIKFLFITSGADTNTPSVSAAKILLNRLRANGKDHQAELYIAENAGHLIEPPFMPLCTASYSRFNGGYIGWGGEKYAHTNEQSIVWRRIIEFFRQNIVNCHRSAI